MADILPINHEISSDDKWVLVKKHYEDLYKIKFKEKLAPKDIQMLWMKMQKLKSEISEHFFRKPGNKNKFYSKLGIAKENENE